MKNITIAVIGPYGSGKTSIAQQLKQREGLEGEDISVYSFKQGDINVNLLDVSGGLDSPDVAIAALSMSNAYMLVIGADAPISYQLGELIALIDTMKMDKGIICINKSDAGDVEATKNKISAIIKGTVLEKAEIFTMSAYSQKDLADLRAKLLQIDIEDKSSFPTVFVVDSAFEWSKGSVALGTLVRGNIQVHKKLTLCPDPLTKEVEALSIQVNQEDQKEITSGARAGIGLKDIYPWYLNRGVEIRESGKYIDIKEGKITIKMHPLYKNKITEDDEITLINHWQTAKIKLTNIQINNNELTANFSADKNIAFDDNDVIIAVNEDLPIRMFRILGRATLSK